VPDGVDWVEVVLRRTSDDRLVVAHNPADDEGDAYGTDPCGGALAA
jgi:glycerophosphoryl diester phosphodiesterase